MKLKSSLLPAYLCGAGLFMQAFDSTAINTALPDMGKSLGETPLTMNLAITSYLIAATVALPFAGWLADRLGVRLAFSLSVAVFAISSVVCAAATTLWGLLVARMMQGAASALMLPIGRIVSLRSVQPHETIRAMAALTTPVTIGAVLGAPIGGALVTYLSWRWVFWLNVPFCLVLLLLIPRFIERIPPDTSRGFDGRGTLLVTLSLVCFTTAIGAGPTSFGALVTAFLLIASAVAGYLYIIGSRKVAHPVLDLTILRYPAFAIVAFGGIVGRSITRAGPFLLALLFQVGFGFSAAWSGVLILVSALGSLWARVALIGVVRLVGFRYLLLGNVYLVAISFAASALLSPETSAVIFVLLMFIQGFSRSVQMVALSSLTYADIPPKRIADASLLSTVFQQLAGNIGLAISVISLYSVQSYFDHEHLTIVDLRWTFVVVAIISLTSIPFFMRLDRGAGEGLLRATVHERA